MSLNADLLKSQRKPCVARVTGTIDGTATRRLRGAKETAAWRLIGHITGNGRKCRTSFWPSSGIRDNIHTYAILCIHKTGSIQHIATHHGHRQRAQKFGESRTCAFELRERTDKQTNKQAYSSQYFELPPGVRATRWSNDMLQAYNKLPLVYSDYTEAQTQLLQLFVNLLETTVVQLVVTDRVSTGGDATASVCPSVPFYPNFWTEWPLTLTLCMCMGHDHSSHGIEGQGQRSKLGL